MRSATATSGPRRCGARVGAIACWLPCPPTPRSIDPAARWRPGSAAATDRPGDRTGPCLIALGGVVYAGLRPPVWILSDHSHPVDQVQLLARPRLLGEGAVVAGVARAGHGRTNDVGPHDAPARPGGVHHRADRGAEARH